MAQVVGFKLSPAGKAGFTVQLVIVPVKAGIKLTETPTVKVAEFVPVEAAVNTKFDGADSVGLFGPVDAFGVPTSASMPKGKNLLLPFFPWQLKRLSVRRNKSSVSLGS